MKYMKIKWNQSGMPTTLVSRLGQRNEFAEFKSVIRDAQNQVLTPVDAEAMARELVDSDGRAYVDMVRELSSELRNAKRDLEEANRRYERLVANLSARGISADELSSPSAVDRHPEKTIDQDAEWEEWNRKFESLLG